MVEEDDEAVMEKSGAMPVPERATVCDALPALLVMASVAVSTEEVEGLKVICAVQFAPAAREAGQDGVWLKSAALEPVMAKARELMAVLKLLVMVMDCAAAVDPTIVDGNVRLDGLTEKGGTTFAAIGSVCTAAPPLMDMLSTALYVPTVPGVNATVTVQELEGESAAAQVFCKLYSGGVTLLARRI
jgi:hypothetical protein